MKKLLITIIFILLVNITFASHETTVIVTPISSYETTNLSINLSITNEGPDQIMSTTLFFDNYTLIDINPIISCVFIY